MAPPVPGKFQRFFATALMRVGVLIFAFSALFSVGILMEGVTHRVGEGNIAAPESPEQTRKRLAVIGGLLVAAVIGWPMVRIGDTCRRSGDQRRLRASRLAAELLLLLGGAGVALGVLIGAGNRAAAYEVADDYQSVGIAGIVGGPVLLFPGWLLFRRSARNSASS